MLINEEREENLRKSCLVQETKSSCKQPIVGDRRRKEFRKEEQGV
jgi:hypothetical protein